MDLVEPTEPPRRCRSPETWARARDEYLAGRTAHQVCDRYDIGLTAFRDRARVEGWRRADQPDPDPLNDIDPNELEALAQAPAHELTRIAWARMAAALGRGRDREARSWMRLYEQLCQYCSIASRRDGGSPGRDATAPLTSGQILEAIRASTERIRQRLALPDSPDSFFPESGSDASADPDPPPNRAARRRVEALERSRQ